MALESSIGVYEFMLDLDGMQAFKNEKVSSQVEEDVWEEPNQRLPESPDMDDVVYK